MSSICYSNKDRNIKLNAAKERLDNFMKEIKNFPNQNLTSSLRSSSSNYFTEEYMEENRDEIDINICEIGKNYGEVKINFGKIDKNYSTIIKNYGIINDNHGTISENFGIIDSNYHTINKNHKVVGKNCSIIGYNCDSIDKNHNKVEHKMDESQIMFDGEYTWPSTILIDVISFFTDRSYRWVKQ